MEKARYKVHPDLNLVILYDEDSYELSPSSFRKEGWWKKIRNESDKEVRIYVEKCTGIYGNVYHSLINKREEMFLKPSQEMLIFNDGKEYFCMGAE